MIGLFIMEQRRRRHPLVHHRSKVKLRWLRDFDALHTSCLVTRRSTSCVILFINGTPIKFFLKRQNTIATSTFGSKFVAGRIAVDLAVELYYNLRILGTEVKGPTTLFGDNQSMITNTSLPRSTLKNRANNYHRFCEAITSVIFSIIHCNTPSVRYYWTQNF